MPFRIRDILLVSSLYDLYLFEEDGRLYELLRGEYQGLNLSHAPELTRVSSGEEAMKMVLEETRFDLIIITLHIEDMQAHTFAKLVKGAEVKIPIVLLVYDNRELKEISLYRDTSIFDRVFVWHGDFRLIIAIIKQIEDRLNIEHDTQAIGVQSIILIEDSVRYYSSFLPIIYTEVFKQSQRLISEGVNFQHRFLRMRARPKILLFTNYEEAWDCFSKYKDYILGVISDINFSRKGNADPNAGLIFAKNVKSQHLDIPILLQSRSPENKKKAHEVGASFVQKDSPTLLNDLRKFMNDNFGFGDFVFRTPDGSEVGRAENLLMLEEKLHSVPSESIRYHGEKNHFSNWLKARTEFWLAHKLRPSRVSDFPTIDALRQNLIKTLREYRKTRQVGIITDFDKDSFDPQTGFARIGGGSLGGKARGLSFLNILIYNNNVDNRFDGIKISVPPVIVIGTNVFDQFLDENDLCDFALNSEDDQEITQRFIEAPHFPADAVSDLADLLEVARVPLAIRSSSLLEDSQFQPFAGVYKTFMLPNNNLDPHKRLEELLTAIKRVYASTFYQAAKDYMKFTSYSMEEEKMAVIIQKMVGSSRGSRFYPEFSGVAKSHNFYPIGPQQSADGIVSVALGLGKTVVEGGNCVKFSPKFPKHLPQLFSTDEALKNNQHEFYALPIDKEATYENETQETLLEKHGLEVAEKDGTLTHAGSTYSHENDTIYDGISRPGNRLVTFAPILKHNFFPLPEITELLLEIGAWGMGTAVEIEFAVNLSVPQESPKEFNLLQLRPMVLS
ncbi:histidine kinase, partial [candidate division KSB1 bacterium]|nr:histidine kinase [candidate division KSB1 bacterium]